VVVTRADFLRLLGFAIAGARIDPAAAFAPSFRIERAEPSQFQPHIGDRFSVTPQDGSSRVRLTLASIVERPVSRNIAQFSLVFDGPDEPIADGVHRLQHPVLGSFELFIANIARPICSRRHYEACFSRHVRT
jgi:hypothetical protein